MTTRSRKGIPAYLTYNNFGIHRDPFVLVCIEDRLIILPGNRQQTGVQNRFTHAKKHKRCEEFFRERRCPMGLGSTMRPICHSRHSTDTKSQGLAYYLVRDSPVFWIVSMRFSSVILMNRREIMQATHATISDVDFDAVGTVAGRPWTCCYPKLVLLEIWLRGPSMSLSRSLDPLTCANVVDFNSIRSAFGNPLHRASAPRF
jgi:hypothetical protein